MVDVGCARSRAPRDRRRIPAQRFFAAGDRAVFPRGRATGENSRKLLFGSDYPFHVAAEIAATPTASVSADLRAGGPVRSGAPRSRYRAGDIADWPISLDQLTIHYEASLRITGLAGERDELAGLLPLHATSLTKLAPSRQARQLAQTMDRHRSGLRDAGLHFGRARVAIRADATDTSPGCV
jgi:hypothetical protein